MDARAGDMRLKMSALLEEMGAMLAMVPRLLDENAALKASGDAAAREIESLRNEVSAVRAELQALVGERSEFQQVFTHTMNEIIDLMNQVVPRLQAPPRRRPFDREAAGASAVAEPAGIASAPPS